MLFTLVYHTYYESKTEILVFRLKITGFLGQLSVFKMPVQTTDRKWLSFSDFLNQCSIEVVTAKFDMSDDLVKEHFESKHVHILVMKCVSEMQFMQ